MDIGILEQNARRAKEAYSFSDYKPGSATAEYNSYCKEADELAAKVKEKLNRTGAPAERAERVDYLLAQYKEKKLSWLSELYAVQARVPSVMIAGPANFPVRAKQKQIAREDALNKQNPDYMLEEIKGIGYNAGTIYSDEINAVERIKAKIAALEVAPPDRWGYNKTEIRRLKERLLRLAPEEFKEQQANITVNGAKTYKEIVSLWSNGIVKKSEWNPGEPHYYFYLPLDFYDGTRHYKSLLSFEVDESGENRVSFNLEKRKTELIPLTTQYKYNLIIGCISGSGNKAVIYQHLKSLTPAAQAAAEAETNADKSPAAEAVIINGEVAQIVRNKEDMRLQLVFAGKPNEDTRNKLKANGFRWAPSCMAWQRLLNENAERTLKAIAEKSIA